MGNKTGSNFSEEILALLKKHVYGLSIDEVSRLVGVSRITASKYLAVLEATQKIVVRDVGNTRLHYLTKNYTEVRS